MKAIREFIERLRRFKGKITEKVRFLLGHLAGFDHRYRFATAVLTPMGIRFKGMLFNGPIATDLVRLDGARVKVAIKWDPADASSISVWNARGMPHPCWVSMPIAGPEFPKGLSFWQHDRLREFAKARDLEFITDEQRRDVHLRLRQHWEKLAGQSPIRESRQARRDVDPWEGPLDDDVRFASADPLAEMKIAPLAAHWKSPRGRKPSKAALAKAKRTTKRKKSETTEASASSLPDTEHN